MSLIGRVLGLEQRASSTAVSQAALAALFSGESASTVTGRSLTPEGALAQQTVMACVRLLSEVTSILPWAPFVGSDAEGWDLAVGHPVYDLLHVMANPELTPAELKQILLVNLCLWGNAYFEIEYDGAGRRRAVWPLPANKVEVFVPEDGYSGPREYVVELPNGQRKGLSRWQMWHVRGFGTDPWIGKSPIRLVRESIGWALATEEYGARFFGNDSRPGGVLKGPKAMSDQAYKRLKNDWESAHRGLDQAHRIAILEEGFEWQQTGVPPEDAQFLDTMKFQDVRICSMYRVPPHMVSIVDKSTSWGTGIEQQSIGFVTYTMLPYLEMMSQSAQRDLMTAAERREMKLRFRVASLLKGDTVAQNASFTAGRNGGWFSVNEIRGMMEMKPVAGGDTRLEPLNMQPLGSGEADESGGSDGS